MSENDKSERQDRYQRRHSQASEGISEELLNKRRDPYKRDRADYKDFLQEEALEDEWFDQHN